MRQEVFQVPTSYHRVPTGMNRTQDLVCRVIPICFSCLVMSVFLLNLLVKGNKIRV